MFSDRHDRMVNSIPRNIIGYKGEVPGKRRMLERSMLALGSYLMESERPGKKPDVQDIASNVVSIVNFHDDQSASGLLLTSNGFILTAAHNVKNWRKRWVTDPTPENFGGLLEERKMFPVFDKDRKAYAIDTTFCVLDAEHDIAIIHAIITAEAERLPVSFSRGEIEKGSRVVSWSHFDGSARHTVGIVLAPSHNARFDDGMIPDSILIIGDSEDGSSGSPITNLRGEVVGVLTGGGAFKKDDTPVMIGTKIRYVSALIQRTIEELGRIAQKTEK